MVTGLNLFTPAVTALDPTDTADGGRGNGGVAPPVATSGAARILTAAGLFPTLESPKVYLDGITGTVEPINQTEEPGALQVMTILFQKPEFAATKRGSQQLIVLNRGGFATATIAREACPTPEFGSDKPIPVATPSKGNTGAQTVGGDK
jgi:hypothetical protein